MQILKIKADKLNKRTDGPIHIGRRRKLVSTLIGKGIRNSDILEAIAAIPRHLFVDPGIEHMAYEDIALPIKAKQTISQPYTVARQTELLKVSPGIKVLEIGTGSGYQCSVLCLLECEVYSIEYHQVLHTDAAAMLERFGLTATLKHGDGSLGWHEHAPFDRILVTAGAPVIAEDLLAQLNPGGIMVIPVGDLKEQRMMRITKELNGSYTQEDCGSFAFVPLVGKKGWGE